MGRPKGSKNKQKLEYNPPPVRAEPFISEEGCEVIEVRVVALCAKGSSLDGVYFVGKHKNGRNYVARLGYIDRPPITNELKKKLGIE